MRSWLTGERVKDIDLFSFDPQAVITAFQASGSYKASFHNEFVANFYKDNCCFQVIKKYPFNTQKETIDNFDFTIICASYGPDGLIVDERFYIDNAQRRACSEVSAKAFIHDETRHQVRRERISDVSACTRNCPEEDSGEPD